MPINIKQVDSGLISLEEDNMSDETQISEGEQWRWNATQNPSPPSESLLTPQITNAQQSIDLQPIRSQRCQPFLHTKTPQQQYVKLEQYEVLHRQQSHHHQNPTNTQQFIILNQQQQPTNIKKPLDVRHQQSSNLEQSPIVRHQPPTNTQKFITSKQLRNDRATQQSLVLNHHPPEVRQEQPYLTQQSNNLQRSQVLNHQTSTATQEVCQQQAPLTHQYVTLEQFLDVEKHDFTQQDSQGLYQQNINTQASTSLPVFTQIPSHLQQFVLLPQNIPFTDMQANASTQPNNHYQLLTQPTQSSLFPYSATNQPQTSNSILKNIVPKSHYQPQIVNNSLQKSLPLNEKLSINNKDNEMIDDVSSNNCSTQTPIILPFEETEISMNILQHVHLIRGILGVNQYDIISTNTMTDLTKLFYPNETVERLKGIKRVSRGEEQLPASELKKAKVLIPDCEVECIDLTSSPQPVGWDQPQVNVTNTHQATERFRYAFRNTGTEEGIVTILESLTDFVEKEILSRAEYVTQFWTGSLMELCVDTIVRTGNSEDLQAPSIVSRLVLKLISAIIHHNQLLGGETLESISNIILKLSECNTVAVDLVERVLIILPRHFEEIFSVHANLLSSINLLENCYHILRILVTVLNRLKDQINIIGDLKKNKCTDDVNIMNLWRKHWRPAGGEISTTKRNTSSPLLTRFVSKLEHLQRFSLLHVPLLSPFLTESLHLTQQMHFNEFQNNNKS